MIHGSDASTCSFMKVFVEKQKRASDTGGLQKFMHEGMPKVI